jgi:hypothetical protein
MRPEEMSRVDPRQRQDGQDESVEKGYRREGIRVRTVVVPLLGFVLFDRAVGIRLLPVYLAVVCAVAGHIVDMRIRRRST